jgi:prefoldin subunit 5
MRYGAATAPSDNADPEMEKQALRNQAEAIQGELDAIRKRLEEMEKEGGPK